MPPGHPAVVLDVSQKRDLELMSSGTDHTLEVEIDHLKTVLKKENDSHKRLFYSSHMSKTVIILLSRFRLPINKKNSPDLTPLYKTGVTEEKAIGKRDMQDGVY